MADYKALRAYLEMQTQAWPDRPISPFTQEFVYAPRFVKLRTCIGIGDENRRLTLITDLVLNCVTEEERMKMFPSPFDLGNGIPVPPEMCTLGALVRDIVNDESILKYAGSSEDQSPDGIHDVPDEGAVEKALKDIKKKLAATLGKDVIGNDSTSLKVLKLLYRLTRRESCNLFSLIKPPTDSKFKPSLEFKDSYPIKKYAPHGEGVQDFVKVIGDLKGYLSLEMDQERLAKVSKLIDTLEDRFSAISREVLQWDAEEIVKYFGRIDEWFDINSWAKRENTNALDEDLYIYLTVLEYEHRAQVEAEIYDKLPKITIPRFEGKEWPVLYFIDPATPTETVTVVPISYLPDLYKVLSSRFKTAVQKAVGVELKGSSYETACKHAVTLLTIMSDFINGPVTNRSGVFAALCAVAYIMENRDITYSPHVHGEGRVSGSLIGALNEIGRILQENQKRSKGDQIQDFTTLVREEFTTFWNRWFVVVRQGVQGNHAKMVARLHLQSKLMRFVSDINLTRNLELIEAGIGLLEELECCAAVRTRIYSYM